MNEEINMLKSQILSDINNCLNKMRIDESMLMFLHIYEELEDDMKAEENNKNITALRNRFVKRLNDNEFRIKLDIFYKLMGGDDCILLLDEAVRDKDIYKLDNEMYSEIQDLTRELFIVTGEIKNKIISPSDADLSGFEG